MTIDLDAIQRRLRQNQDRLEFPYDSIHPWNQAYSIIDELKVELDKQLKGQQDFFKRLKPKMYLWVVIGENDDHKKFISYYSKILPRDTEAILLFDHVSEATKKQFLKAWPNSLILNVPDFNYHYDKVRFTFFSSLYPKLGEDVWNLFLDLDEFLPLFSDHYDIEGLCELLERKKITQLTSIMLDVWELQKCGQRDLYFDSFGDKGHQIARENYYLNHRYDPVVQYEKDVLFGVDLNKGENFFIKENGFRVMNFQHLRGKLLGYNEPNSAQKVVLVKPTSKYSYSGSSHEPHYAYQSTSEILTRYPLIHMKFIRETHFGKMKEYSDKETKIVDSQKEIMGWRNDPLYKKPKKLLYESGIGPYQLLGDHDDDKVFEMFGDRLTLLSGVFTKNFKFNSLKCFFGQTGPMFPTLFVDPLL